MAGFTRDARGNVSFNFRHPHTGERKSIGAGKLNPQQASRFKVKLEALILAVRHGLNPDDETTNWIQKLSEPMARRLAHVGLLELRPQDQDVMTLGELTQGYIDLRTDVKPRTRINLEAARKRMVEHFGADRPIDAITAADAEGFLRAMQEGKSRKGDKTGYAPATIGRTIRRAQQFFRHAIDAELVTKNPFAKIKAPAQTNRKRIFFVTREMAAKVLEKCPDTQWRLIFALCRFAGLRCPSEVMRLKWDDIDLAAGRMLVHSPKTEHHEGRDERWVPIFPDLRPHLEDARELAPDGAVNVITRYRDGNANMRTQFTRIVKRAGLKPWPRLFHNLRGSCESELMQTHPVHCVVAWLGHDALIAAKHYLSVTDEDFERASAGDQNSSCAAPARLVTQRDIGIPADKSPGPDSRRHKTTPEAEVLAGVGFVRLESSTVGSSQIDEMPRVGMVTSEKSQSFSTFSAEPANQLAAQLVVSIRPDPTSADNGPIDDPELFAVVRAWPHLDAEVKASIMVLVMGAAPKRIDPVL